MVKSSQCDIYRRNMLYINSTLPVAEYLCCCWYWRISIVLMLIIRFCCYHLCWIRIHIINATYLHEIWCRWSNATEYCLQYQRIICIRVMLICISTVLNPAQLSLPPMATATTDLHKCRSQVWVVFHNFTLFHRISPNIGSKKYTDTDIHIHIHQHIQIYTRK